MDGEHGVILGGADLDVAPAVAAYRHALAGAFAGLLRAGDDVTVRAGWQAGLWREGDEASVRTGQEAGLWSYEAAKVNSVRR